MIIKKAVLAVFSLLRDIARQLALGARHLVDRRNQPAVLLGLALMALIWVVMYLILRYDHLLHLSRMPFARCAWGSDMQALVVVLLGVVFGLFSFVSIGEVMVTLDRKKRALPANWKLGLIYSVLAIGSGAALMAITASSC